MSFKIIDVVLYQGSFNDLIKVDDDTYEGSVIMPNDKEVSNNLNTIGIMPNKRWCIVKKTETKS